MQVVIKHGTHTAKAGELGHIVARKQRYDTRLAALYGNRQIGDMVAFGNG